MEGPESLLNVRLRPRQALAPGDYLGPSMVGFIAMTAFTTATSVLPCYVPWRLRPGQANSVSALPSNSAAPGKGTTAEP